MAHYAQISRQLRAIFLAYTPLVEPLSLDEAFLDVNGCEGLFGPAPEVARQIKARIRAVTNLVASVGVARNKFLAKLASDHGKPDGFVVVTSDRVKEFLTPLPVGRLWGVGAKGEKRLHDLGIHTIGQLAALAEKIVVGHFGEAGRQLWRLARGHDDRAVIPDREAKSLSTETTFSQDIGDRHVLRTWLLDLVEHVASRLRQEKLHARTVEVKIRSSEFQTWTRSRSLPEPTNLTKVLWQSAAELFELSLLPEMLPVRLLGVGASRLTRAAELQGNLFDGDVRARQTALDRTIDGIREQFGNEAIQRASLIDRTPFEPTQEP